MTRFFAGYGTRKALRRVGESSLALFLETFVATEDDIREALGRLP